MKQKRINIVIKATCKNCPYFRYEYDDNPTWSGYFCEHDNGEYIAEDDAETTYKRKTKEWEASQKTLLPRPESEKPVDPMLIPDWCPLEDAE